MDIRTLLIANRGEIACRIARSARAMGIVPVGVHSSADANARHVREIGHSLLIGGGAARDSYLRIDAVIEAARRAGADAVHPGYGFLSENPDFARACQAAGIMFIGPTPETLEAFGDKARAKAAAIAAGVPVIAGAGDALTDRDAIAARVQEMGLPILLKAVGGGGGRGQRLVNDHATLAADIAAALREARSTFGSEGLLLERFLPEARHVEIQIAGDGQGRVVHLYERDCTLQRRHQKVIEEAPATGLPDALLAAMRADAVRLGESVAYRGLGTVEFLVADGAHYFLEVNPRLQVEHPVTEAVTGLDLVELQLRIAQGAPLPAQSDITLHGHAFEARLYAEDPAQGFAPSTGRIVSLSLPGGARIDSGVDEGDSVTPHYDPMIAKIITHAETRETALTALAHALGHTAVEGVTTNRGFLLALARHADFGALAVHTRWIDAHIETLAAADPAPVWAAVAAALFVQMGRVEGCPDPWRRRDMFTGWRLGLGTDEDAPWQSVSLSRPGAAAEEYRIGPIGADGWLCLRAPDGTTIRLALHEIARGVWQLTQQDTVSMLHVRARDGLIEIDGPQGRHLFHAAPPVDHAVGAGAAETVLTSPLTGLIVQVLAVEGATVAQGETIAILESMKMEIPLRAQHAGRLASLTIAEGAMIDRGQPVAEIQPEE
ncbi:MAG: 3-methylcrotonyl-CoA carboxylase alpha subunit [Rhodobacteraceae bacterium HLUCCA12]|nr:MAG: 3-methylcrotonyl-CoA carboxylase alpha subunit [Rhodobacteraceae bacterium HLUCCA12]